MHQQSEKNVFFSAGSGYTGHIFTGELSGLIVDNPWYKNVVKSYRRHIF